MKSREAVVNRINELCSQRQISYYVLSYRSAVPMSTLMNIIHGKNPTITTISRLCDGFEISMKEFFSSKFFDSCVEDD